MMNDDTRNTIEPDDPSDRHSAGSDQSTVGESGMPVERGMPALGQYRGTRPRAWWLTPLVVVLVAGAGAVWTVHTFLARHDAEAKAHRDAVEGTATQGRVFRDAPVAASAASTPAVASAPAAVSGPVVARSPVAVQRPAPVRSYYDAPLLATGSVPAASGQGGGLTGMLAAEGVSGSVVEAASSVAASVPGRPATTPGQGATGTLAQSLTPTATPRVRAGTLGERSLILAQGAKIDCAGDTAFDSTEAGCQPAR
jgi:type IV secretion system protein VirB10